MSRLKDLIHEVHRRSLWQVVGIYVLGGWIMLQVVDTLAGALSLPDWASPLALFLLIMGLPIVLATAFVQEGVGRRDAAAAGEVETTTGGTPIPGTGVDAPGGGARLFTWRNAVLGGVLAFALWGVGAAGWMIFFGQRGQASGPDLAITVSETRIAVLPFSVRGGEEYAYLHEGLVDLLSTKLDGAGDLQTVDPLALLNAVELEIDEPIDPEAAQAVARRFGAGRYLTGSVVEAGGRISVRASLYDEDGDAEITAEAIAESEAGVFAMVDDLARQLLAGRDTQGSARLTQLAALTTNSLPALKAFLEGSALFRDGLMEEAAAAFDRAVAIDTTFALAYYRLSIAHEWWTAGEDIEGLIGSAEQAVRFGDRLSARDRRLLEALLTWRGGDGALAERQYRDILLSYPDEVEAWSQLAEVLFHYGPPNGRSVREARAPLERVLELDPDHLAAMIHLIRLDALDRDTATLRVRVGRILALRPDHDYIVEASAVLAHSAGDSAAISRLTSEPAGLLMLFVATNTAIFTHNLDAGLALAGRVADPRQPANLRLFGLTTRAEMYLGKGQWRAAVEELEELDSITEADSDGSVSLGLHVATAVVERPDDEVRAVRDRIARLAESLSPLSLSEYVLGLLSARLGDEASALSSAALLDDLEFPPEVTTLLGTAVSDLALSVRARAAHARGDHGSALEFIRDQKRQVSYTATREFALFSRAYDRYMVGTILQEQGNYEEALGWYESIEGHTVGDLPFLAPSHLRRAEIHEELGDLDLAAFHYAEFVNLWADADPEYQPLVEAARDRLRALMPDSG